MIWILGITGLSAFYLGYLFYSRILAKSLFAPFDQHPTPAVTMRDDKDFVPTNPVVLFGHHFASIAGAGPIVGPLIAVLYYGWVPAVLWIIIGSIFLGGVHDFTALMTSVRFKARSIADISGDVLTKRSRTFFSLFVYLTLILVIAVFGNITARTFVREPQIVIPTFGLIFLAPIFGLFVYRLKSPVWISTAIALVFLIFLVFLGERYPVVLPSKFLGLDRAKQWFIILMLYSYLASVLPVWLLLQPRDYLSMWILFAGLGLGYYTVFAAPHAIHIPAFTTAMDSVHHEYPIWPMLFVIIACGAISGFHSLVAGGTTSKQLAKESHARPIGYGGMLMEGVLAFLVVLLIIGGLSWDPSKANELSYQLLMSKSRGPIVTFGTAFGSMAKQAPLLTFAIGMYMGILMLNAFVLTSLDTSTRLARFIAQEYTMRLNKFLANKHIATFITIALASWFGLSGSYHAIWALFGAANQLVAALTLIVVSAYIVGMKRPRLYTVIPALFMTLTTIGALVVNITGSLDAIGSGDSNAYLRLIVALLLILLALLVFFDAFKILFTRRARQ